MISCRALQVAYGSDLPDALRSISFEVPTGSICAVIGPTGAGKTTLLHALSGLIGAFEHGIRCSGSLTIAHETHSPLPNRVLFPTVGMLLQEPHLQLSGMADTVEAELRWTLDNLGLTDSACVERISSVLHRLGCAQLRARNLKSLSGGELHRVAFASVLVAHPQVLLLDEPVSSFDQNARAIIARLLSAFRRQMTILFTDTDADLALVIADRVIVLDSGSILFDGARKAFLERIADFSRLLPTAAWAATYALLVRQAGTSALKRRLEKHLEGE